MLMSWVEQSEACCSHLLVISSRKELWQSQGEEFWILLWLSHSRTGFAFQLISPINVAPHFSSSHLLWPTWALISLGPQPSFICWPSMLWQPCSWNRPQGCKSALLPCYLASSTRA